MSDEELSGLPGNESEGFVDVLEAEHALLDAKAQLESLLNATDALESLINHLDSNEVVSAAHKQAISVSFENLIGNVGLSVNDVLPALESHKQGVVSTESLKDHLHELWKRIVSAVLSVIQFVKNFWKSINTYRRRLRISAEYLAKHGAVRRYNSTKRPTVDLGIEIKSLVLGSSVISDPDALIRSVSTALEQYKVLTNAYGPRMVEIGNRFESSLTSGKSGNDQLIETCAIFDTLPVEEIASKMKAMVFRDPRFGRRLVMAAPPTIGGWTLFFLTMEEDLKNTRLTNPLNYAQAQRTTGVKFALTNVNFSNITSGSVKTASGMQVEIIARRVIEILDTIDTQERAMALHRIESQIKNVLRAGEQYQNNHAGDAQADQSVIRFVRNYAGWALGPVDQMTTNLLTVSRNLLTYARKSLNTNH